MIMLIMCDSNAEIGKVVAEKISILISKLA